MKPLNLGSCVEWTQLLTLLGIQTSVRALPTQLRCPVCKTGRMSIFQHYVAGGQWHYCEDCGSTGDMLQLATAAWRVSYQTAIKRCRDGGIRFPHDNMAAVADYVRWHAEMPELVCKIWKQAHAGLLYSPDGRRQAQRLYWKVNPTVSWNLTGIDQVLGYMRVADVEKMYACGQPSKGQYTSGEFVGNPFTGRIFKGKDWHGVLVIPYWDLPGRIAALQFIGRNAEDKDRRFCSSDPFSLLEKREAGLAFHPTTAATTDTVVAFRDPYWYMRLQCRGLEIHSSPSHMVCWKAGDKYETQNAWKMLNTKKLVFWDTIFDPMLLRQAIRTDGHITLDGISNKPQDTASYFSNLQPWEAVGRFEHRSRPWPLAMAKYFTKRQDNELEDFLIQFSAIGGDLDIVRSSVPAEFKTRIDTVLKRSRPNRSVVFGHSTIEEKADGWYVKKADTEERILNVVPRFDQLVWYPKSQQSFYRGRLLFNKHEYPFMTERSIVEGNTLKWLQDEMLRSQAGVLQGASAWNKRLVMIASRFQEPAFATGSESVGWDGKDAFVFPSYRIEFGGRVTDITNFLQQPAIAGDLPKPGYTTVSTITQAVVSSPGTRAFWLAYAAFVANIVAPAINRMRRSLVGVGLSSQQAISAATIACDSQTLRAEELQIKHLDWPTQVLLGADKVSLRAMSTSSNIAIEASATEASMLLFNGPWNVLEAEVGPSMPLSMAHELRGLLPDYLLHLAKNKFADLEGDEPLVSLVKKNLGSWIHHTYGIQPYAIYGHGEHTCGRLFYERDKADASALFTRTLYKLLVNGHVTLLPAKARSKTAFWQDNDAVYVPKFVVRQSWLTYLDRVDDLSEVTRHLQTGKGLIADDVVLHGHACWSLSRDWFSEQIQAAHRGRTTTLRLAEGT